MFVAFHLFSTLLLMADALDGVVDLVDTFEVLLDGGKLLPFGGIFLFQSRFFFLLALDWHLIPVCQIGL